MDNKNSSLIVDHGIDIIGDEWENEDEEEPEMPPKIKFEERIDPVHPYCTNWPVKNKKGKDEKV